MSRSRSALASGGRRAALLLPALTLLTAFFAAGIPALVAGSETSSLQQLLNQSSPAERSLVATTQQMPVPQNKQTLANALDEELAGYAGRIPTDAGPDESAGWAGASLGTPFPLLAQGSDATIDLEYRDTPSAHLRLLSGTMPTQATGIDPEDISPPTDANPIVFDVALSAATAKLYGVKTGSVIPLTGYRLKVTGIYQPTDPSSEFWYYDRTLQNPAYVQARGGGGAWSTAALVGPGELPALTSLFALQGRLASTNVVFVVPLDTSGYRAEDVTSLITTLNASNADTEAVNLQTLPTAGPLNTLTSFEQQRESINAILALVMSGVTMIGAVTVLLSTQLVIAGRRRHYALLRARGQSRTQLAAQALRAFGLPNLTGVLLVGAAIRLTSAADWTTLSTVLLAAVAAVGLFAPPLLAVRDVWGRSGERSAKRSRKRGRSPRRLVLELLVLLLAAAAVYELRSQGLGGDQQGSNPLGTLTPIMVAALATVIAAHCYRMLLRPAEQVAAKRGGPVSFIGLAAASRSALPLVAPAFVITLTLTLAALGGLMDRAVDDGRAAHAWQSIGADGVVTLQPGTTQAEAAKAATALATVPGVTHVSTVESQVDYTTNSEVYAVDPGSYSAVAADTPWPIGAALPDQAVPGPVPVLVEAGPGHAIGTQIEVSPAYAPSFQAKITGYVSQTPAAGSGLLADLGVMVVPSWAVAPNAQDWPASEILVSGTSIDESAMNTVLGKSLPGATAAYRADILGQYTHAPLANLAELGYLIGLLVAGAFGICAILLSLGLSAPARERRLTLLGTLGVTPRQANGIALTETLPLLTATVLGGLLAAGAMPAVFGDALDLSAFTGLPGTTSLGFDPGIALLAALTAAVLTALAVALQATTAHRRQAGAELRMGEDADA